MVDHYAVGRLAAEHLLGRGLRRLAFYGETAQWFARQRRLGFVQRALEAGAPCAELKMPAPTNGRASWQQRIAPLQRWLQSLDPPVGVMALQDYRARVLVDECQRLGLRVPHDVAIIGVDNDPIVCEFCRPTLSSVDRLMAGKAAPKGDVLIPPDGVVQRQSTDTIAVDDPHVTAAVHFMHDHLGEPFGINAVLAHLDISRRHLEASFHRLLSSTPHDYLCRARVERARQMLLGPHCPKIESVASACGFTSARNLRSAFLKLDGLTPQQYRHKYMVERALSCQTLPDGS
jgi:LacI family transcriptional regulator